VKVRHSSLTSCPKIGEGYTLWDVQSAVQVLCFHNLAFPPKLLLNFEFVGCCGLDFYPVFVWIRDFYESLFREKDYRAIW